MGEPSSSSSSSSSLYIECTPTIIPAASADAVVKRTNLYIGLLPPGRRLHTLRIAFHPVNQTHLKHVRNWMDYAARCGVAVAILDISLEPFVGNNPPYFYFDWEAPSVADLTLCGGFDLWLPPSHFKKFTSLAVLTVHEIRITDKDLVRMVTDIALLRVLDIRRCPDLLDVHLPGPRIDRLTIVGCPKARKLTVVCPNLRNLTVACPNLRSFHLRGEILGHYAIENAPALKDVYMTSCGGGGGGPGAGLPQTNLAEIFQGPSDVKILTLCSLSLQYIAAVPGGEFRMFPNLRELQLMMLTMASSNLMDIHSFSRLYKCRHLKKLFIELPTCMDEPDASTEIYFEEKPPEGGFERLKTIKIKNFKGYDIEMRLVSLLLRQAAGLDSLDIIVTLPEEPVEEGRDDNWTVIRNFDRLQWLRMEVSSLMRRASPNADLTLTDRDDRRLLPRHSKSYHH